MPPDLDSPRAKEASAGAPAWILTFADLMSLLLAFFVLLFSFSEIDRQKFKELAGSMRDAFGVQREIRARDTPLGTSIIARDFSPSATEPTIENEIRQQSVRDPMTAAELITKSQLLEDLAKVREHLGKEIQEGAVEVGDDGEQIIIIRVREKGSFPSGSAALSPGFEPVILKLATVVKEIDGNVVVAGHTDNLPIHNEQFRSNWELSSARAATVLHRIVEASGEPRSRFRVVGHADTRPISGNQTAAGRATNRRVEILLLRGADF